MPFTCPHTFMQASWALILSSSFFQKGISHWDLMPASNVLHQDLLVYYDPIKKDTQML